MRTPNNDLVITTIGKPAIWLIQAANDIGLDYSELTHIQTNHFRNHAIRRHKLKLDDFDNIQAIITEPDMAIIGTSRFNIIHNVYVKRIGEYTFIYLDEVLNSRKNKVLRSVTMYKLKREKSLEEVIAIISGNGKTDISQSKIIGAGGNPDGEAEIIMDLKP